MSLYRRNPKRDANEADIVSALEAAGVRVWPLSGEGIPDLLCFHRGRFVLLECKTGAGRLTAAQERFFSETRGSAAYIVKTPKEALDAVL